jgi:NADH:ubiquinone reductase (H+-translocating)
MSAVPRILIVGGGYVGMYTALRLQRKLRRRAEITVVDPESFMTYQPFLPEASAGSIEPRHVIVPLRRVLKHCTVLTGAITEIRHAEHEATFQPVEGEPRTLSYDQIVVAPGSVSRTLPIPGLREHGIGFKTVGEAIYLRNHFLARLDAVNTNPDPELRRRALTFVFIGGGYAGIEAFAELEDMARSSLKYYPNIEPEDMHWVLIEATERILPEVSKELAAYTAIQLTKRGMDVRLNTRLESCVDNIVKLSDGDEFPAETIVWTAGVKPNPLLAHSDLPLDEKGRLKCTAELRVDGMTDAWGAGDSAAVPDLTEPGHYTSPSAQHAVRQAKRLGDNVAAAVRGGTVKPYRHSYAGSVASLGLHKGVAEVYKVKLRGFPAWFMHRTYHVSRIPTLNRKIRVVADWTLAMFFKREAVSLGQLQNPRAAFMNVAEPGR